MRKLILDVLFPIECLGCGQENVWLCEECLNKLEITKGYFIPNDYKPSDIDGFCIATDWENELLQEVIHKFKYNFAQELAEPLGGLLIKKLAGVLEVYPELRVFEIVPVPLHRKRLAWRGFNQAELLAQEVANKFDMQLNKSVLKRIKNTSPQVKLKSEMRAQNIAGAFGVLVGCGKNFPLLTKEGVRGSLIKDLPHPSLLLIKERRYLLIDDVITTGATMNECARILKENGAEKVYGLALARG